MRPLGQTVHFIDAGKSHGGQLVGGREAAAAREAPSNQGLGGEQEYLDFPGLYLQADNLVWFLSDAPSSALHFAGILS